MELPDKATKASTEFELLQAISTPLCVSYLLCIGYTTDLQKSSWPIWETYGLNFCQSKCSQQLIERYLEILKYFWNNATVPLIFLTFYSRNKGFSSLEWNVGGGRSYFHPTTVLTRGFSLWVLPQYNQCSICISQRLKLKWVVTNISNTSGNNLPGIASHFTSKDGQIAK